MADSRLTILMILLNACVIAGGVMVATHVAPLLINRFKKKPIDETPYECGMEPFEKVERHRFSIHFYLVAVTFIVFDVEAIFLLLWASSVKDFAASGITWIVFAQVAFFIGVLVLALIYEWQKGGLNWDR